MPPHRTTRSSTVPENNNAVAGGRGNFACGDCGETFRRTEHLMRHVRKHTGERPFLCPLCSKSFNRPDSLKRHEQLHADGRAKTYIIPRTEHLSRPTEQVSASATNHTSLPNPELPGDLEIPFNHTLESETSGLNPSLDPHHVVPPSLETSEALNGFDPFARGLDPAVMSNTNWLPLADMPEEWSNPFDIFLDSPSLFNHTAFSERQAPSITAHSSPADSFAVAVDSPASTTHKSAAASDLDARASTYVASGVTRLATGRKRATSVHSGPSPRTQIPTRCEYGFPPPSDTEIEPRPNVAHLSQGAYNALSAAFRRTCTAEGWFEPFVSDHFLSCDKLNHLIDLAIEHFIPSLPFLNVAYLHQQCSSLLYLALAMLGSRYEETISETSVWGLTELLRRVLVLSAETLVLSARPTDLELAQSKLLLCISLLYSGRTSYFDRGRILLSDICHFCRVTRSHESPSTSSLLVEESRIRTKHAIWLIDCMSAYQHFLRPLLSLEDAGGPLPISDSVWQSLTATSDVSNLQIGHGPSLRLAVRDLYLEKKVNAAAGEFARILLIHGLFHQTWHVAKTSASSLSSWEPQAKSLTLSSPSSGDVADPDQWLAVHPTFSRWRNAACDCIDVLHWHANSQIGANAGHEHPTVFFLHLSRIVLLSPLERVREIVLALSGNQSVERAQAEAAVREIFRWAHEDCYKARLAIIHAGVLLYHVRRHSVDSFYEPEAVCAAILCLWAYGCAYQRSMSKNVSRAVSADLSDEDDEDALPAFIHLDRPCDDELVQLFITNGNRISPNVTRVGDICALGGPKKVLKLGCALLTYAKNWDLRQKLIKLLTRLQAKTNVFETALRQS